jgi:hypothetical protein
MMSYCKPDISAPQPVESKIFVRTLPLTAYWPVLSVKAPYFFPVRM